MPIYYTSIVDKLIDKITNPGAGVESGKRIQIKVHSIKKITIKEDCVVGGTTVTSGNNVYVEAEQKKNGTTKDSLGRTVDKIETFYRLAADDSLSEVSDFMSMSELQTFLRNHNPGNIRLDLYS